MRELESALETFLVFLFKDEKLIPREAKWPAQEQSDILDLPRSKSSTSSFWWLNYFW